MSEPGQDAIRLSLVRRIWVAFTCLCWFAALEPNMMFRVFAGLIVISALGAGSLALAAPASARPGRVALKSVTVRAIDRNGHRAALSYPATAVALGRGQHGAEYLTNPHGVLRVPEGRYLIGADIETLGPDNQRISDTVAARAVLVSKDMTVTLDARHGHPVSVSLALSQAQAVSVGAKLCARVGQQTIPLVSAGDSIPAAEQLFAVPSASKDLRFAYGSSWLSPAGTQYNLAGASVGIPGNPRYTFRPSGSGPADPAGQGGRHERQGRVLGRVVRQRPLP